MLLHHEAGRLLSRIFEEGTRHGRLHVGLHLLLFTGQGNDEVCVFSVKRLHGFNLLLHFGRFRKNFTFYFCLKEGQLL